MPIQERTRDWAPRPAVPPTDVFGTVCAEIIMLRARCNELAQELRFRRSGVYAAEVAVAESLAVDILRTRRQADGTDLGQVLAEAESLAGSLLRALQAGGQYRGGFMKFKQHEAKEIAEALQVKLSQFPMNISGHDVSMIDLLEEHKIGASYANDERLDAFHGVIWSDRTIWPRGYREIMMKCSRPIRRGVYQVQTIFSA